MKHPNKWIILKTPECYKVFATWIGSYTEGESWQINSGVSLVKEDDHFYYFHGYSGSLYKCYKKNYGVATSYGNKVLADILKKAKGQVVALEDRDDWSTLLE